MEKYPWYSGNDWVFIRGVAASLAWAPWNINMEFAKFSTGKSWFREEWPFPQWKNLDSHMYICIYTYIWHLCHKYYTVCMNISHIHVHITWYVLVYNLSYTHIHIVHCIIYTLNYIYTKFISIYIYIYSRLYDITVVLSGNMHSTILDAPQYRLSFLYYITYVCKYYWISNAIVQPDTLSNHFISA